MRLGKTVTSLTVLVLGLAAVGCETHTGNAALLGGAGGSLIGAAIGSHSHGRAGEGALLGGAIGAIGGALVGNEMDRQERDGGYGYDRYDGPYYDDYYEARPYRPRYRTSVHYYRVETRPRYSYRHRHHHHHHHHHYRRRCN